MPKQQINFPESRTYLPAPAYPGETADELFTAWDPAITVHWEKGDFNGENGACVTIDLAVRPPLTQREAAALQGSAPDATNVQTGALSRAEVNRLVVVLRRARDAAYGRDE